VVREKGGVRENEHVEDGVIARVIAYLAKAHGWKCSTHASLGFLQHKILSQSDQSTVFH
jgi:hypothetical protein